MDCVNKLSVCSTGITGVSEKVAGGAEIGVTVALLYTALQKYIRVWNIIMRLQGVGLHYKWWGINENLSTTLFIPLFVFYQPSVLISKFCIHMPQCFIIWL